MIVRPGRRRRLRSLLGKEVNGVHGHAGDFSLATRVEGHPAGTLVRVTVSALDPSRLVLDFSNRHEVLTDACVLLCGSTGALVLLELGYTGPLVRRPRLAAREEARAHGDVLPDGAGAARPKTKPIHRK